MIRVKGYGYVSMMVKGSVKVTSPNLGPVNPTSFPNANPYP